MELHTSRLEEGLADGTRSDDLDDLFDVLSNGRRRAVLHYLKQHRQDCPIEISELSRVLVAWEEGIPRDQVGYDERHSVHTSLRQFHLPKMASSGLVRYNDQETEVELTPIANELDVYVETVGADTTPWSKYFVTLSLTIGAALVATSLGVVPFTVLSGLQWSIVTVVAFIVSSLAFAYDQRQHRLGEGEKPPLFTRG
ncbi:DUF7344 domain-containing protein [Haloarcula salinisoli]|uniref:DUF7344 domain-containing protein n=1 Tax=Haloarcula salinisoli TaxID=2487746 RepID=A0A8J8C6M7_9EURY|nr:hypothetical protein [Halomicroarcula salinisoli]MBX0286115.1 hypothetical protein [Halomicroarcula salinisoli]MBX0302397.1 hypothetical protein [Halomicroarcula salinisoli]